MYQCYAQTPTLPSNGNTIDPSTNISPLESQQSITETPFLDYRGACDMLAQAIAS